jgi:hypothetical protein
MAPQQHLGKVVQQRRFVDHRGVVVHAVRGKTEGKTRTTVGAAQHLVQAGECGGLIAQLRFDRRLWAEASKERRDAHHHKRGDHGFGVGDDAARAVRRRVREQLQRHQRVLRNQLAEAVRIDRVFVRAQCLQRLGGAGEHRQLGGAEVRRPRGQVAQRGQDRLGQGGSMGRHGEPRWNGRDGVSAGRLRT